MGCAEALDAIEHRAAAGQVEAEERWAESAPDSGPPEVWVDRFRTAGRPTLNFHPDRIARSGHTVASGLAVDGVYLLTRHLSTDVLLQAVNSRYGLECASRKLDRYVEVQVHGDVLLADDAEAVVLDPAFRSSDVERDLALAAERFGFELRWHRGSELPVHDVPDDFRGPTMPLG